MKKRLTKVGLGSLAVAVVATAGFAAGATILGASDAPSDDARAAMGNVTYESPLPTTERVVDCGNGNRVSLANEDPRSRIPVAGRTGEVVGYMDRQLLECRLYNGMKIDGAVGIPVTSEDGQLVGYATEEIGFVTLEQAADTDWMESEATRFKALEAAAAQAARGG